MSSNLFNKGIFDKTYIFMQAINFNLFSVAHFYYLKCLFYRVKRIGLWEKEWKQLMILSLTSKFT